MIARLIGDRLPHLFVLEKQSADEPRKPGKSHSKSCSTRKKLDATIDVVGRLVKVLDYMRSDDARFIFEMDLVKHSLCEAGYTQKSASTPPNS
jgi:hypothetical protein